MKVVEVFVEGNVYRCYPTLRDASAAEDKYIVAGVGSITLARETGAIVALGPVLAHSGAMLKKIAPLIHEAVPIAC